MSDDPYTIYKLDEDLKATFEDNILPRLKDGEDVDDMLFECADSEVPVYYATQLELANNHNAFMHDKPDMGDGDNSPMEALALNIFEYCYQGLQKMVDEWKSERELLDCLECEDSGWVIEYTADGDELKVKCTECDYWEEENE